MYLIKLADQAERFMWPGFLAKLRESFSLDPLPDAGNDTRGQSATVSRAHTTAYISLSSPLL
jgi:hypothetical protein